MKQSPKNYLLEFIRYVDELEEKVSALTTRNTDLEEGLNVVKDINADLRRQVETLAQAQQLRLMQVIDEADKKKDKEDGVEKKLLDLCHPISPNMTFLSSVQDILVMQSQAIRYKTKANTTAYFNELARRILQEAIKQAKG